MPLNRGVSKHDAEQADARILANRYQVIKKIGSGNYGTAFLVRDLNPGKSEELKVLKEIHVGDLPADETVDAVREANLLSKLSHPNIVKFCDSFLDGEYFCLVTEYCEGGDLSQRITELKSKGKRLDENSVMQYFIQLIMAVDYMHKRRVLHRDLKSRNIFLKGDMVKVGDFGISRILMGTTDQASTFVGTPYYMSPEVLYHEGYNSKSDVWSIGCILFELCAKKHAFEGQGLMGVMYKIVEGKPPRLPEEYSEDLQSILDRIFVKEAHKRISAAELLKVPMVERYIERMQHNMAIQYKDIKDLSSTIQKREAEEISELLSQKATIKSLGGGGGGGGGVSGDDDAQDDEATLTPKEQMTLRKMQKADERARQMAEWADKNYRENFRLRKDNKFFSPGSSCVIPHSRSVSDLGPRATLIPPAARRSSLEAWSEHKMLPVRAKQEAPQIAISSLDPSRGVFYNPNGKRSDSLTPAHGPAVEDDEFLKAANLRASHSMAAPSRPTRAEREHPRARPMATLVPSYRSTAYDERPITPMKDTNIYDLKHSDMAFKDALLTDGKLAETYYSQYDHEFEEAETEEEQLDETASDAGNASHQDDTMANFFSYLQLALNEDATADKLKSFSEDPVRGVFSPSMKETKIFNLRRECIQKLGEPVFHQVYSFLKKKRTIDHEENETRLMNDLRTITGNMTDCFLVDQLIFLENN